VKSLLRTYPKLVRQLSGKHLLLLLDYDGTLTPIKNTPEQAFMSERVKVLLRKLSYRPHTTIGIVSGRDFNDLKKKIGLKNLIYASNHGFKIQGRGMRFETKVPALTLKELNAFCMDIARKIHNIKGALVEKKRFSFVLHYRLVNAKDLVQLKELFYKSFKGYKDHGFRLKAGKKIIEVLPPIAWNKGEAVRYILRKIPKHDKVTTIYIGDDKTDEDAYKVLSGKNITVKVGKDSVSCAKYYLSAPDKVYEFLDSLLR